jgi:uncharacterized protein
VTRFEAGRSIALREIWRGRIWTARPATVVRDAEDLLMLFITPPMRWMCPRAPDGRWLRLPGTEWELGERVWESTRGLSFAWPGAPHAALLFWDEAWVPRTWYVNLQEPLRRTEIGFDYMDEELDALVALDGSSWSWKDEDELAEAVRRGNITTARAAELPPEGEAVVRRIVERSPPFDRDWLLWRPDPSWNVPELPTGWETAAPAG